MLGVFASAHRFSLSAWPIHDTLAMLEGIHSMRYKRREPTPHLCKLTSSHALLADAKRANKSVIVTMVEFKVVRRMVGTDCPRTRDIGCRMLYSTSWISREIRVY